jgi:hypothetical protein
LGPSCLAKIAWPCARKCDACDKITDCASGGVDEPPPLIEIQEQFPPPLSMAVLLDELPFDRTISAHSSILYGQVQSCTQRRHRPILR